MSGGHFNYANNSLQDQIFPLSWTGKRDPQDNPFRDLEISDLVFDVFGLIHDLDYFESADYGEGTYRKHLTEFKDKWFGKGAHQKRMTKYIDESIAALRADLIAMITGDHTTEET